MSTTLDSMEMQKALKCPEYWFSQRNSAVEIYQSAVAMANIMALMSTVKNSEKPLRSGTNQSGKPVLRVPFIMQWGHQKI